MGLNKLWENPAKRFCHSSEGEIHSLLVPLNRVGKYEVHGKLSQPMGWFAEDGPSNCFGYVQKVISNNLNRGFHDVSREALGENVKFTDTHAVENFESPSQDIQCFWTRPLSQAELGFLQNMSTAANSVAPSLRVALGDRVGYLGWNLWLVMTTPLLNGTNVLKTQRVVDISVCQYPGHP